MEARLWTISGVSLALFVALGYLVETMPIFPIDIAGAALAGHGVQAAIVFTESGRFVPVVLIGLAGIGALAALRRPWWIGAGVLASEALSQGAAELIKHVFHRVRPDYWLVYHESDYSYPSGHACTAIVFYGGWLLIVLIEPLPKAVKIVSAVVLAAWMVGIDWSRLALGAHYATDVLGGTLFGVFWLSGLLAILARAGVLPPAKALISTTD